MRKIRATEITKAVKKLCINACINIDPKVQKALIGTLNTETNPTTKFALDIMIKNATIASQTSTALCQDTGIVVVFVEIGQNIQIVDGYIEDAINQGIREAYTENFFRKSIVDPISRQNTLDNTPAVIHYSITNSNNLVLHVMPKGFGSENMSKTFMLSPADGVDGIQNAVIETVKQSGGNPCPPTILGIGIGGTIEKAALLSKKALLRDFDSPNPNVALNNLESQLLLEVNKLNIGAQGLGGKTTVLKVFIEKFPTHIAGLPLAITTQCHAVRHQKAILQGEI